MTPSETFRSNLRLKREQRGLSQAEIARRMTERGHLLHQTQIAKIESGARNIPLSEADALAAVVGESLTAMISRPLPNVETIVASRTTAV